MGEGNGEGELVRHSDTYVWKCCNGTHNFRYVNKNLTNKEGKQRRKESGGASKVRAGRGELGCDQ